MEVLEAERRVEDHNYFSCWVVLLMMLDARNAFNSARWSDIMEGLTQLFRIARYLLWILVDYLKGCSLIYATREEQLEMTVISGMAQGS